MKASDKYPDSFPRLGLQIPHYLLLRLPPFPGTSRPQAAHTDPRSLAISAGRNLDFLSPWSSSHPHSFPSCLTYSVRTSVTCFRVFCYARTTSPSTSEASRRSFPAPTSNWLKRRARRSPSPRQLGRLDVLRAWVTKSLSPAFIFIRNTACR